MSETKHTQPNERLRDAARLASLCYHATCLFPPQASQLELQEKMIALRSALAEAPEPCNDAALCVTRLAQIAETL